MDKNLKNGIKIGVGVAYLALDAMNNALEKLQKEGKISKKDSERLVQQMAKEYEAKGRKYAEQAQKQVDAMIKSNHLVTKKDLAKINAELVRLNKQIKKYMN